MRTFRKLFFRSSKSRPLMVSLGALLLTAKSLALPIGFGVNQGQLEYNQISSKNFKVYFEKHVPQESLMILNTLEAAKPSFESWIGLKRDSQLPIITSAVTSQASFANPITDVLEIQTLGQGNRDLFLHEYVHNMMYLHLQNFLGPAGSVLHLPWMPAWYIEGLAEALTVSMGSAKSSAIEKYHALSGRWPSFDRLHSLYGKGNFFLTGYSVSGSFVSWIIQKSQIPLSEFLQKFYDYTLPYYFHYSLNPWSSFLPMDEILREAIGLNTREAYEAFKKETSAYWNRNRRGTFLSETKGKKARLTELGRIRARGKSAYLVFAKDGDTYQERRVSFDPKTGWADRFNKVRSSFSRDYDTGSYIINRKFRLFLRNMIDSQSGIHQKSRFELYTKEHREDPILLYETSAKILNLVNTKNKIVWIEQFFEKTKVCSIDKPLFYTPPQSKKNRTVCRMEKTLPEAISIVSTWDRHTKNDPESNQIWFRVEEQRLTGDRYSLIKWDPDTEKSTYIRKNMATKPLYVTRARGKTWALDAKDKGFFLTQLKSDGSCESEIALDDFPVTLTGLSDGSLILGLYAGVARHLKRILPKSLPRQACTPDRGHISPILYALKQNQGVTLKEALKKTSFQSESIGNITTDDLTRDPHSLTKRPGELEISDIKQAEWQPRSILTVPWIGGDDALGYQFGIVSVPLMDHMQNEELRATALYGLKSSYPNVELSLLSTRFWPTLILSIFKRQRWNRIYKTNTGQFKNSYYDDEGSSLLSSFGWRGLSYNIFLNLGISSTNRRKFIGPDDMLTGRLVEPNIGISYRKLWQSVTASLSINGRTAPKDLNEVFEYNVLGFSASLGISSLWKSSSLSLGLEGSRTRGVSGKMPLLQEFYTPLKTFVPGGGGGYNNNNFSLTDDGGLFVTRYGDTKARARLSWTIPIIRDLNRHLWILYFKRLDFTSFLNHGGAWYEKRDTDIGQKLITAHGHNVDLSFENKGVNLNLGLGLGQVINDPVQVYFKAGFDAIF